MKKIIMFLTVFIVFFFGLKAKGMGFGLIVKGNERPDAGKYKDIINGNGGRYIGDDNKNIYLTFDCGYENGYTDDILDVLKKTNTKAIFFITGHYLESATDLVQRMIDEGHLVGNHTYSHKDFTKSSDEAILTDLKKLESLFKEKIGKELSKYVRPPRGDFDERSLKLLNDNGYKTVFWSLAYVDWDKDKFFGNQYSYKQIMKRIHNGAIILMHTVGKDNSVDLESVIFRLKEMGYIFSSVSELL